MKFTYEYESCWGEHKVIELKPGGDEIYVDQENKQEYVDLMVDFMLNKQISRFFDKFNFGFHQVCNGDFLYTFEPEELELMICGNPVLDFKAL